MLVSELASSLATRSESTVDITLGDVSVSADAERIHVRNGPELALDEQAERVLASFLDINAQYLAKCPPNLRAHNLNYWLDNKPEAEARLSYVNESLVGLDKPGALIIPVTRIVDVVVRNFNPDDEVVKVVRDEHRFHIDIKTGHHIEVRPDERIPGRQVGDITHGGCRIFVPFGGKKQGPPEVRTYLHRLWCTNGCTSPTAESTITLRGRTVPEIEQELEDAARQVLSGLDAKLADYAATADIPVVGNNVAFVHQLGREAKLGSKIMDRIVAQAMLLPEPASIYDIMNIFTEVANHESVQYASLVKLQGLGGDMAFNTERIIHRCSQCERPLPESR